MSQLRLRLATAGRRAARARRRGERVRRRAMSSSARSTAAAATPGATPTTSSSCSTEPSPIGLAGWSAVPRARRVQATARRRRPRPSCRGTIAAGGCTSLQAQAPPSGGAAPTPTSSNGRRSRWRAARARWRCLAGASLGCNGGIGPAPRYGCRRSSTATARGPRTSSGQGGSARGSATRAAAFRVRAGCTDTDGTRADFAAGSGAAQHGLAATSRRPAAEPARPPSLRRRADDARGHGRDADGHRDRPGRHRHGLQRRRHARRRRDRDHGPDTGRSRRRHRLGDGLDLSDGRAGDVHRADLPPRTAMRRRRTGTCSFSVTVTGITPIGELQGSVGPADNGLVHRSPFAPPSGNNAGSQIVFDQGRRLREDAGATVGRREPVRLLHPEHRRPGGRRSVHLRRDLGLLGRSRRCSIAVQASPHTCRRWATRSSSRPRVGVLQLHPDLEPAVRSDDR